MARLAAERGQEEDGVLSIDEFETIHGWHGRPAASRPQPEPEPEPEPDGGPDAEDAFDTRDYWEKFNADPGCYEWYGGDGLQESIVQSVVQCARLVRPDQPTAARVLDVGTGTSPILFLLTERERFTAVEGTDWSARACDFMSAQAEQRGLRECLRYRQADGRRLDAVYDEGSWDVVLDKVRCTTTRPAPLRALGWSHQALGGLPGCRAAWTASCQGAATPTSQCTWRSCVGCWLRPQGGCCWSPSMVPTSPRYWQPARSFAKRT